MKKRATIFDERKYWTPEYLEYHNKQVIRGRKPLSFADWLDRDPAGYIWGAALCAMLFLLALLAALLFGGH